MNKETFRELVEALHDWDNMDRQRAAAERLHKNSSPEDIPRLLGLLEDESFWVREVAAWPLSDLGATDALPQPLEAFHCGHLEGHDNDSLTAALIGMADGNPNKSRVALETIMTSGPSHLIELAEWLLQFCQPQESLD